MVRQYESASKFHESRDVTELKNLIKRRKGQVWERRNGVWRQLDKREKLLKQIDNMLVKFK
ncbi:hypothetical protein V7024_21180 [Bacillus sp. JJ864]|uniref:hypothetical protein n=1 Tax=Bacillus sp. JJ864 TaxID=3122975 RepID=UPI002FFE7980